MGIVGIRNEKRLDGVRLPTARVATALRVFVNGWLGRWRPGARGVAGMRYKCTKPVGRRAKVGHSRSVEMRKPLHAGRLCVTNPVARRQRGDGRIGNPSYPILRRSPMSQLGHRGTFRGHLEHWFGGNGRKYTIPNCAASPAWRILVDEVVVLVAFVVAGAKCPFRCPKWLRDMHGPNRAGIQAMKTSQSNFAVKPCRLCRLFQ